MVENGGLNWMIPGIFPSYSSNQILKSFTWKKIGDFNPKTLPVSSVLRFFFQNGGFFFWGVLKL